MNCQEALKLLYDIIDKETSDTDTARVQEHLEKCRNCFDIYRFEGALQAFINEKIKQDISLPNVDILKSRILSQIDGIDAKAPASDRRRPPFFRAATALALAASLVLVVGAIALLGGFFQHQANYVPLRESHLSVMKNIGRFQNPSATSVSLARVSNDMNCSPCEEVKDFQLAGGLIEKVSGAEVVHFVYDNDSQCVSVFVAGTDELKIPDEIRENAIKVGDASFFEHYCRNCRLLYYQTGTVVIVTVTTDRDIDLLQFLPEVEPI